MKKEDLQAALEAISKSGIQVAGDLVLEKNVEYEVANVEEGGIGIQIVNGSTPKVANSSVTEPHLLLLYMALTKEQWIDGNDADFKALFSGSRDEDCELVWLGKYGKGTLVELFKQMAGAGLIEVPQGFTLSAILEGHFKDKNDQWLTGLDKGDAANDKAMPVIKECIKQMKTDPQRLLNGDYEEDEDFRSEYDQYDQQDMHWHKQ